LALLLGEQEMIEINNEVIGSALFGACLTLLITLRWINKYLHLMQWLERNAPMTLETYKRLGDK
jgi:hypothetical protein